MAVPVSPASATTAAGRTPATDPAARMMIPLREATVPFSRPNGFMAASSTHETRRAAADLSDERIDDTLVWTCRAGDTSGQYHRLMDERAPGAHPARGGVMTQEFDVVCLGGGVAGEAIATGLRDSGLTL